MMKKTLLGLFVGIVGLTSTNFINHAEAQVSSSDCLLPSSSISIVTCASPTGDSANTTSISGKKYNPGHYVTIANYNSKLLDDTAASSTDGPAFMQTMKNSGVKGIMVRYYWKDLESTKDNYTQLSRVKKHLDLAHSYGLKFIILIEDREYDGRPSPLPAYLMANDDYYYRNVTGSYNATLWNNFVHERLKALVRELGTKFDSHPALEGVGFQETATNMGSNTVTTPAYDPVLFKEKIISLLNTASAALPKSNVFWYMNYMAPGYSDGKFLNNIITQEFLGEIGDLMASKENVIIGGPDIKPEDESLVKRAMPLYPRFHENGSKLFGSFQNDSYREIHATATRSMYQTLYWTPLEMYVYGRDNFHVQYMFWNYKTWLTPGMPAGEYRWEDAIPVIKANPVFNPTTPQRFQVGQRVQTNTNGVNIRSTSTLAILGTQAISKPGTILLDSYRHNINNIPMVNNQWWKVNFDTGVDGLVNDAFLSPIGGGSALPDVTVTSLTYNETTHTFTAVVKNQGTVATPANTVIGVGYSVNGLQKTWGKSDTPLAAGASVTIGTNLTGTGAGPYTIPNGTHTIKAWVDDVNRFAETNENNNQLTKQITIGDTGNNVPPTISGTPATTIVKNTVYNFIPTATDANGNTLIFAIQNKPAWATFNTNTGRLTGTPTATGTFNNIRISVTDGLSAPVFLPAFNITVTNSLPPIAGQKYNPGHYVTLSHNDSFKLDDNPNKNDDGPVFVQKLKDDGVKGLVVRYPWKEFEPTQGNYNYVRVKKHLDLVQSKGLKMVVFVDDKSFSGAATVPDYIKNNSNYVFANKTGGVSATRWNPFVKSRFIALWTNMGAELDNHPALEGVVYSETSSSVPPGTVTVPVYDPVVNKQVIIDTLTAQSNAFPKSNVFWMVNFFPNGYHNGQFLGNAIVDTYIGDIADIVLPLGVIMGGPDILPEDKALVNRMYPYYDEFKAKGMKLFCSAQNDSFRHMHNENTTLPFYTPQQIFNYGKNELHVNYIWWNYKTWIDPGAINKAGVPIPPGEYKWSDAVPIIKANPVINAN